MAKDKGSDARFQGVSRDPRFRRPAAKKSKTVIDSRFQRIFTDEKFRGTSSKNPRGVPSVTPQARKSKKVNDEMNKFYQLAPASESENEEQNPVDSVQDSSSDSEGGFHWDAASSSDEEQDIPIDDEVHMDDLVDADEDGEDVPLGDSTEKIAIMNCNWDHVTAADLFVLLQSFLDTNAPGRRVVKVAVHQSDFGSERMEREEMYGPMIEGMPEDDDEDDSLKTKEELAKLEDQRSAAIRNYERTKRKYFFAIAEFDSINTACIVYDELDGVCGGFVSEALDLRFVPEDTPDPADKRPAVSEADKVPAGYTPPKVEVGNLTMEHSKVKCTWDEDPADRKILMKKLTPAQIADLDLEAYLESASEDDDVDADALRKALLSDAESDQGETNAEADETMGDMEMSFSRAVESVGKSVTKRLAETGQATKSELSQWEQYLEKKKEAKKAKKLERRQQIEAQKMERIAAARANSKAAKRLAEEDEGHSSDHDEAVDAATIASDSRLEKLFSDPKFAVDPTHPSFKKSSIVNKLKKRRQ